MTTQTRAEIAQDNLARAYQGFERLTTSLRWQREDGATVQELAAASRQGRADCNAALDAAHAAWTALSDKERATVGLREPVL